MELGGRVNWTQTGGTVMSVFKVRISLASAVSFSKYIITAYIMSDGSAVVTASAR